MNINNDYVQERFLFEQIQITVFLIQDCNRLVIATSLL